MKEVFIKFWYDETAARRYIRGGLQAIGGLLLTQNVPEPLRPYSVWGAAFVALGGMIGVGDPNPPKEG
jgi:hypothetical protein